MSVVSEAPSSARRFPLWRPFLPPTVADEADQHVCRLVHWSAWCAVVAAAVSAGFNWAAGHGPATACLLALATLGVVVLALNFTARSRAASILLIASLPVTISCLILFAHEGIRDTALLAYPAGLLLAGALLERRTYVIIAASSIAATAALGFAHVAGWLPTRQPVITDRFTVFDTLLILGGVSIVIGWLTHSWRRQLARMRETAAALAEANRRQTAQAEDLRLSEERLRTLLDLAADAFFLADSAGRIIDANRRAAELTGRSKIELLNVPLSDLLSLPAPRAGEPAPAGPETREGRLLRPDGTSVLVEVNSRRMPDGRTQSFVRDISRRLEQQDQLRQVQKMDAIGNLAGGVAHDFNNLLTVFHGQLEALAAAPGCTDAMRDSLRSLQTATDRATDLTRQLLVFSRRRVLLTKPVDVGALVRELSRMLPRLLGEHIAVECTGERELHWIEGDAGMLQQLLINLAVNARDAMPRGGRLELAVDTVELDAAHLARHPDARLGAFVRIRAADSGTGMPPAVLQHLFEPFFTTKEVGKGAGLGLAMVYGIVRQHSGWIEVESRVGAGSSFTIFLPRRTAEAPAAAPAAPRAPRPAGSESILVVEDETLVRDLVIQGLRNHGYHVVAASNGPEALDLWQHYRRRVRLLFTDLIMPGGLSGVDLAEIFRREAPGLPVVICSGHNTVDIPEAFRRDPAVAFLEKPFAPEQVLTLVRSLLDTPPAAGR